MQTNAVGSPDNKDDKTKQGVTTEVMILVEDIIMNNNNCDELEEDVDMVECRDITGMNRSDWLLLNKVIVS